MDKLWTDLLTFINQLVSPDWNALIGLIPLSVLGLVVLYLVWVTRRFAMAGPTQRRPVIRRQPPASFHAPPPSYAPVLGAIGTALLLFGLVFHGWVLALGVLALLAALVYWL